MSVACAMMLQFCFDYHDGDKDFFQTFFSNVYFLMFSFTWFFAETQIKYYKVSGGS